jgi:mono/diheme cytochrome c family protein
MAATDQKYRNPKTLDLVFGVSCVLMLLTSLWMFAQDYNRQYKSVQREFRDVEEALNEHQMLEKLPDHETFKDKQEAVKLARANLEKARAKVRPEELRLMAQRDTQDNAYRLIKADFDSKTSYYNIAIEHYGKADDEHKPQLAKDLDERRKELDELQQKLTAAQDARDKTDREIEDKVASQLKEPQNQLALAEDNLKKLTAPFDRLAKATAQRRWKAGDALRDLPILDAFESPTKINQIWLPDLTIDYSFKDVPRFDRCTSCHLAIDRATFDKAELVKLGDAGHRATLSAKLVEAEKMLRQRKNSGEKLGFDPADLPAPTQVKGAVWAPALFVFLSALLIGVVLGGIEHSLRLGLSITTVGAALTLAWGIGVTLLAPHEPAVKTVDLTAGQVTQYCAHPRLDLFVDANSPHPIEKFGCTICHAGQGSATDFLLASHTPATAGQQEHWHKEYDWEANHFWDYPMLSSRFVESTCLKCHHQVTDLIRYGNKEEAPKLLKGYNLVRENGCFGCHEIAGIKGFRDGPRAVGPDLRLEPQPALEYLTSAEQEKARNDLANPPGMYRKVGPSLRRLAEKTNQEWVRRWLQSPRGFRPDTRMPHFYNLSNNSPHSHIESLPPDQQTFPDTEISAIAHYLLSESQASLKGQDAARLALEKTLNDLHAQLKQAPLRDKDYKALAGATQRLTDLALLSAPQNARQINDTARSLKTLQERTQDVRNKESNLKDREAEAKSEAEKTDRDNTERELKALQEELRRGPTLDALAASLIQEGKPTPISAEHLVGEDGTPASLPQAPARDKETEHQKNGRRLFTQKGCLACHSHAGTAEAALGLPAVNGSANFAPNLSRIAAKVRPELPADVPADKRAEETRRRQRTWLVQWIMNPNIHHPRTRMPITHLSAEQASDIAEWLLGQEVKDWEVPDPAAPKTEELVALAHVYLAKAPGITHQDVENMLPLPRYEINDKTLGALRAAQVPDKVQGRVKALGNKKYETQEELLRDLGEGLSKEELENARPAIVSSLKVPPPEIPGIPETRLQLIRQQSPDADELRLSGPITDDKLKWYIGRKSIGRLGCFGCHDVPGFEQAKPIGTALNDWGKKDPERLAFEDADIYVREAYNIVKTRNNPKDPSKPARDWKARDNKPPFEELFYEALEHHQREGFLHLKLEDPRSYDYHRIRTWDDRLRMPQFRFARSPRRGGESDEDYKARQELEEAEAREAVMVFILGLVADPINTKYLNRPNPDRQAEVKGRQVLDKFNCAGCHQVRPGVFEFKSGDKSLEDMLVRSYRSAVSSMRTDFHFPAHNGWVGPPQPADRLIAFGNRKSDTTDEPGTLTLLLAEALRFTGSDGVIRDIPAGNPITLAQDQVIVQTEPFGGTFTDLMVKPLRVLEPARATDEQNARSILPPPLAREGERVQPNWLYSFLLNPTIIRPQDYMALRMPKFNMSNEDARTLVDYFAGSARLNNPGGGVTAQYLTVDQKEPEFWRHKTKQYLQRLNKEQLQARLREMAPAWEQELERRIADASAGLEDAKKAARDIKDEALRKQREKELSEREAKVKAWKEQLAKKDFKDLQKEWEHDQAYATDAIRAIVNKDLCLQCHSIGRIQIEGSKGPNLDLTAGRLRPEWVKLWVASPKRMFSYDPIMPQNFPNDPEDLARKKVPFVGTPLETVEAARDVLMDLPRLMELPGVRALSPAPAAAGGGK